MGFPPRGAPLRVAGSDRLDLRAVEHWILDLDGCLMSGPVLYPGALELLELLCGSGRRVALVSNNSTETGADVRSRLLRAGLRDLPDRIIVVSDYAGRYVLRNHGPCRVAVLGAEPLRRNLAESGHTLVGLQETPEVLVVGRDTGFDYGTLRLAARSLQEGTRLVATNLDGAHPGVDGCPVPETGALVAAILAAAGGCPVEIVGKPEPYLFREALGDGIEASVGVIVGDTLDTDIRGGSRMGFRTVWISHGRPLPREAPQPDLIVNSVTDLLSQLLLCAPGRMASRGSPRC